MHITTETSGALERLLVDMVELKSVRMMLDIANAFLLRNYCLLILLLHR